MDGIWTLKKEEIFINIQITCHFDSQSLSKPIWAVANLLTVWWQHNKLHRLSFIANDSLSDSHGLWARHDTSPCRNLRCQSCLCPWPPPGFLQQGHSTVSGQPQQSERSAQENCHGIIATVGHFIPYQCLHHFTLTKKEQQKKSSPQHWLLHENNCDGLPWQMFSVIDGLKFYQRF